MRRKEMSPGNGESGEKVVSLKAHREKREHEKMKRDEVMRALVYFGENEVKATMGLGTWARMHHDFSRLTFMEPEEIVRTGGISEVNESDIVVEWLRNDDQLERLKRRGETPEVLHMKLMETFDQLVETFLKSAGISREDWMNFHQDVPQGERKDLPAPVALPSWCNSYLDLARTQSQDNRDKKQALEWLTNWHQEVLELVYDLFRYAKTVDGLTYPSTSEQQKLELKREQSKLYERYGRPMDLINEVKTIRFEMVEKLMDRAGISIEEWREFIRRGEF